MEERKLAWVSDSHVSKKTPILLSGTPYEIDYFTSTYFENVTQIKNHFQEEIDDNTKGAIVVLKK